MEYYVEMERNERLLQARTWLNFTCTVLSKIRKIIQVPEMHDSIHVQLKNSQKPSVVAEVEAVIAVVKEGE